ncbi:GNAT family N-acetyltransferase [Candidatus Saccharibacteria bacterium]|nr:GNAT family N-acetyltransferase [Candidatus Saccharibacteria bacterium]
MKIITLTTYTPEIATRIRELLIQLSRSKTDRGEIPEAWFIDLINSPYHDMLLAIDDTDTTAPESAALSGHIVGIATLSIIMGPIVRRMAYLEDFVTDESCRGQGIGSALWDAMLDWARAHACTELNFTSGKGREAAWAFYQHKGAEIYDTNFFRLSLS